MEPTEAKVIAPMPDETTTYIYVVYSEIERADDVSFLVKDMNEFFFCSGHPFAVGDKVKISIKKGAPPNVRSDHDSESK